MHLKTTSGPRPGAFRAVRARRPKTDKAAERLSHSFAFAVGMGIRIEDGFPKGTSLKTSSTVFIKVCTVN